MSFLKSKVFHSIIGFAISAGLIGWICATVNWNELGREFTKVNFLYLGPSLVVMFLHFWLRALRWRYLLARGREIRLKDLFDSLMLGNFATYVLPLRAGEFIRPYFLTRRAPLSFSASFVSVVIERFFDLAFVLVTFGVMVPNMPGIPDLAFQGAISLAVLAVLILLVMIAGTLMPDVILRIADFCLKFLPEKMRPPLKRFLEDFLAGAKVLGMQGNFVYVLVLSVAVWLSCYFLSYLFLFLCGSPASFWVAISVTVIVALAVAAPSAPGFVGVYQAASIAGFSLFGMSKEAAVVYSVVTHGLHFLIFIGYGLLVLFQQNISLGQLNTKSHQTLP